MEKESNYLIGLEEVAPDAAALVEIFRKNGAVSFQHLPVNESRHSYLKSCELNGLAKEDVKSVDTISCPVNGGHIGLRIYRGQEAPVGQHSPLVIFIHGGGWVLGNLDTHDPICRRIANQTESTVISIDYRLAPEHKFPTQIEDCYEAIKYIVDHEEDIRVDLTRVVIAGDSAGGSIATIIANHPNYWSDGMSIIGQVLLYPVTDLTAKSNSYGRITSGFPLTAESMLWFREMYLPSQANLEDERISPLLAASDKVQVPMFIVTVGLDPLADEGIDYASASAKAGTRVVHNHLPRHMHGIFTAAGKIGTGSRLLDEASFFIRSLFNGL